MSRTTHHHPAGPSQRQLRVGEVIRRALAEVVAQGDLHDDALAGVSITVGEVRMTPDLKLATVFVLPLGGKDAETVIRALNRNKSELRRAVNRAVTLKFSPDLKFVADATFDALDRTREMFADPRVARDLDKD